MKALVGAEKRIPSGSPRDGSTRSAAQEAIEPSFVVAAILLVFLAGIAWFSYIGPSTGHGPLTMRVGLCLLLALAVVAGGLHRKNIRPIGEVARKQWPAMVAPVIGTGSLVVSAAAADWAPLWILQGDMVWNTVQSLFIHDDGGLVPSLHANPAPLTNEIFALFYGTDASLGAVFRTHALVAITLLFLSSLLSGMYVARRLSHLNGFVRFCLVLAVGWLPFTNVLVGPLIQLGHVNSLTSLLLLWLSWIVATEHAASWVAKFSLLGLASTAMVASWAPLVVVPMALGVMVAWPYMGRSWSDLGPRPLVWPVISLLQFSAYVLFVTIPDLRGSVGALSSDGAVVPLSLWGATLLCLIVVFLAVNAIRCNPRGSSIRLEGAGMLVVLAASAPALGYLVMQRLSAGVPFWGYYPVKLVGLILTLLLALSVVVIGQFVPANGSWGKQVVCAGLAFPLYLFGILSFSGWMVGPTIVAPTLSIMKEGAAPDQILAVQHLINAADADTTDSISLFADWGTLDGLANGYLLQLEANDSSERIRWYAYFLDPDDPASWCSLLSDTADPINVFTTMSSEQFFQERLSGCQAEASRVTVLNAPPPAG